MRYEWRLFQNIFLGNIKLDLGNKNHITASCFVARLASCLLFLLDLVFSYPVIPPITPLNHLTAGHFLLVLCKRLIGEVVLLGPSPG